MKFIFIHLFTLITILSGNVYAQGNSTISEKNTDLVLDTITFDSRLLIHYSYPELVDMRVNNPQKFAKVSYYYLHSYSIENMDSEDNIPFDIETFDISKYERFRGKTDTNVKNDPKKGIRVILISIDDLTYKLPIHEPLNPQENEEN